MKKLNKKGMVALGVAALLSTAVMAQAETRFAVQDANGVDKMVVTDKGYIGVGSNNPTSSITSKGPTISDSQMASHYVGNDTIGSGGFLALRNSGTTAAPTLPLAGQRIGYMLFGSVGTDGAPKNSSGLVSYAESNWSNTSFPSYFLFEVAPANSPTRVERMRITSAGNVGIGTPTPTQRLEVNGGIRLNTAAARPACSATVRGVLWMTNGATGVADTLSVCMKDAAGNFAWENVTFAP